MILILTTSKIHFTGSPSQYNKVKKEIKGILFRKGKINLNFGRYQDRKSKIIYKLSESISKFSMVFGYRVNI